MKLDEIASLFANSRDIVFFVDPDGRILEANNTADGTYGYSHEELLGLTVFDIRREDSRVRWQMTVATASGLVFETVHYRKDGTAFPVEVSSSAVEIDGKRVLISLVRDITQRREIEQMYRDSEERYRGLFTAMNEGACIQELVFDGDDKAVDYRIIDVNPRYEQILGIRREEALGLLGSQLYGQPTAPFLEHYASVALSGRPMNFQTFFEPMGKYFEISVFSFSPKTFVTVFRDVTESVLSQEEIRKSNLKNESLVKIINFRGGTEEELLNYTFSEVVRITSSDLGILFKYDEQEQAFFAKTWVLGEMQRTDDIDHKTYSKVGNSGLWHEAVVSRKPIIVNDVNMSDLYDFPADHPALRNVLAVPLFNDDGLTAMVGLANAPRGYDQMDIVQVTILFESAMEIVKRKRTEQQLANETERLLTTIAALNEGVVATDTNGNVRTLNRLAERLTGWTEAEAVGRPVGEVFQLVEEGTGAPLESPADVLLNDRADFVTLDDCTLRSRDGQTYYIRGGANTMRGSRGEMLGIVFAFDDVSQERSKQQRIAYLSYHDSLTGLYNRRFFEEEMKRLNTERNMPLAIIMGDVNGLKLANDVFGHLMGDELLRKSADAMRKVCRADDIIARWGGDEFIILLPRTEEDCARRICERIRTVSSGKSAGMMRLSISLGYDVKHVLSQPIEDVLRKAEDRMYHQKQLDSTEGQGKLQEDLLAALFKKSWHEEQHSRRVTGLSVRIGRAMGLPEERLAELAHVARLHDIGKVLVSKKTLNKASALTDQEWEEVKRHPEAGYRILKANRDMAWMADYVLYHHERSDGSGYPKGMRCAEIPLMAKILSVADAYDTMTSGRYRLRAMSREEAAAELAALAGLQFDREVVRVFLDHVLADLADDPAQ